jgi:hypothetical protein
VYKIQYLHTISLTANKEHKSLIKHYNNTFYQHLQAIKLLNIFKFCKERVGIIDFQFGETVGWCGCRGLWRGWFLWCVCFRRLLWGDNLCRFSSDLHKERKRANCNIVTCLNRCFADAFAVKEGAALRVEVADF